MHENVTWTLMKYFNGLFEMMRLPHKAKSISNAILKSAPYLS